MLIPRPKAEAPNRLPHGSVGDQPSEREEESLGDEIFLRSVSELRQKGVKREDSLHQPPYGLPEFHIRMAMEKNRNRPRLIHHWFGREMTVCRCPLTNKVPPHEVAMQRIGKGNSRVTSSWPEGKYVIKLTTVAYDHGEEELLSAKLREVCALVLHSGPLVVTGSEAGRSALCLSVKAGRSLPTVQERVQEADPWVRELEAQDFEYWHFYVEAAITWLRSRGLQLSDITASEVGLGREDGTLMLYDLAGWSITGVPAWACGSGFERYLSSRCPRVLSVIQSHRRRDLDEMFTDFAIRAGP